MTVKSPNNNLKAHITPINPFTDRKSKILQLIVDGKSNKEIAHELGITGKTVGNHICGTGFYNQSPSGIFGIVEEITGYRPRTRTGLISLLAGDVII